MEEQRTLKHTNKCSKEIFKGKKEKFFEEINNLLDDGKRIIMNNTLHPPSFKQSPWKSHASNYSAPTSESSQMAGGVDHHETSKCTIQKYCVLLPQAQGTSCLIQGNSWHEEPPYLGKFLLNTGRKFCQA